MKLPANSLGVSDALQFGKCPALFHYQMVRHTDPEFTLLQNAAGQTSMPLAFGNALHMAAEETLKNPDIYPDDAVDIAWAEWGHLLEPEHRQELKEDVLTVIQRSEEAPNLELISCEEEMSVPLFVGSDNPENKMLDEEHTWYSYRFRIDGLYRDRDDPTHLIIRDFKTYRQPKFQKDVDGDYQFSGYAHGVKQLFPECERVTIWVDQVKWTELFTTRTDYDMQLFAEWMESTIRSILDKPEADVMNTIKLNEHCSWCPLLMDCGIRDIVLEYDLDKLDHDLGNTTEFAQRVTIYEQVKDAAKMLDEYRKRLAADIMERPGIYNGREYYKNVVPKKQYDVVDLFERLGKPVIESLGPMSKTQVDKLVKDLGVSPAVVEEFARDGAGYTKLGSRKAPAKKKG